MCRATRSEPARSPGRLPRTPGLRRPPRVRPAPDRSGPRRHPRSCLCLPVSCACQPGPFGPRTACPRRVVPLSGPDPPGAPPRTLVARLALLCLPHTAPAGPLTLPAPVSRCRPRFGAACACAHLSRCLPAGFGCSRAKSYPTSLWGGHHIPRCRGARASLWTDLVLHVTSIVPVHPSSEGDQAADFHSAGTQCIVPDPRCQGPAPGCSQRSRPAPACPARVPPPARSGPVPRRRCRQPPTPGPSLPRAHVAYPRPRPPVKLPAAGGA